MASRQGWNVRWFRDSDAAALRQFRCANQGEEWTARVEDMIKSDVYKEWQRQRCEVIVMEHPSITGALGGVIVFGPSPDDSSIQMIFALGVAPDVRRQGIASNLKQACMDALANAGHDMVASHVDRRNSAMNAMNRQFGSGVGGDTSSGEDLRLHVVVWESPES